MLGYYIEKRMVFQTTVVIVAGTVLILSLCVIGVMIYRQKYNVDYPPVLPNCPDYWEMRGKMCVPHPNLGNVSNPACNVKMDFTTGAWAGTMGNCNKYKWAQQCNLTWDGITNNAEICKT